MYRQIKGYENLYEIDTNGNVKSLRRNILLKQSIICGYSCVGLYKNKKQKMFKVHRLVAEAFIANPDNLPEVNHKDENKLNNCVDNLEWCTKKYNSNYGTRVERIKGKISGEKHYLFGKEMSIETKQKISYTLKGRISPNKGKKASEETRKKQSIAHSNITEETRKKMRNGYYKHSKELVEAAIEKNKKKVKQYDKDGNYIKEWDSIKEAADALNLKSPNIIACCNNKQKTCGNYVWKY